MARTFRSVPPHVDEENEAMFRHGLVQFPARKRDTDGWLYEDCWTAEAKRCVKRQRNRKIRRQLRENLIEE